MNESGSYPKVSFIMPVLNCAEILENCLQSIQRQTYPRDRYEIILADGGSRDNTREVGRKYGAVVLDDKGKNMEEGKRLALSHATGDYIVFVDADNEITHPDYIELAIRAMEKYPQAIGVEGYYPPSPRMSSFCAYLTHLLHISDPVCWMMSVNPILAATDGEIERWTIPDGTLSYPMGANGFVYRRADLEAVRANQQFSDTHVALYLLQTGRREWLRLRGRGVHHYYVQTLGVFLQKRRRSTVHFFNIRNQFKFSWTEQKPPVPGWLACLYGVTFLGPVYHTVRGLVRDRDWRWLWHVPASVASVLGVVWGVETYLLRSKKMHETRNLQPKQTLKKP